ncbi:MAG: tetratricopeptide repeat protein [Saprospiraceae bacterium]
MLLYLLRFFIAITLSLMVCSNTFGQLTPISSNTTVADTAKARLLLSVAKDSLNNGQYEIALEKTQAAQLIYENTLGINALEVADCWEQIGNIYAQKGTDEELNNEAWENALAIRLSLLDYEHPLVAKSYFNIGIAQQRLNHFRAALEYFKTATEIYLKIYGEEHEEVAKCYGRTALAYRNDGKYEQSIEMYKKTLDIQMKVLEFPSATIADTYHSIGLVYKKKADYERAIQYNEKSLAVRQQVSDKPNYRSAVTYMNLGNIYSIQEKYDQAIEYHKKTLAIHKEVLRKDHPMIAYSYNNLGNAYERKGDFAKAIEYHELALDLRLRVLGEDHYHTAFTYSNLGRIYKKQEQYEISLAYLKKALEIDKNWVEPMHPAIAERQNDVASLYFAQGKYNLAIMEYSKSLVSLNYSRQYQYAKATSLKTLIKTLHQRSLAHFRLYEDRAQPNFLKSANDGYMQAIGAVEYQMQTFDRDSRQFLSSQYFEIFEQAVAVNLALYQETSERNYLEYAFQLSEQNKSLLLFEAMQEVDALAYANLPDSITQLEFSLRKQLTAIEKQKQTLLEEETSELDSTVIAVSGEIFDLKRQQEELKGKIEANYPDYLDLKYETALMEIAEIQKELLHPEKTLLEYFVGDSTVTAFVINQDAIHAHQIKKDFPLNDWVSKLRQANHSDSYRTAMADLCSAGHQLYEKLVAPIATHLKKEVVIIPDGVLGYVPFEALLTRPVTKPARLKNYAYWIKDKQISYCYSATLLREVVEKQHVLTEERDNFLAFAPFYEEGEIYASNSRGLSTRVYEDLKPLPHSGAEVHGIQQLMGGRVLQQAAATEESFIKNASRYRILHLSTHGKANDKAGDYSFLAFTEQKDSIENELLYVRDLYNLQLNADMVVLSACETGIGELQRGEGIISLARGFTYAGAKSIITSLWSVEDESTKDLMLLFYQNLKKGMTKDAALRKAKLAFINDKNRNHAQVHPFYWSGFVGIGDMGKLNF